MTNNSLEEVIQKSREIHGEKYDYSLITEYNGSKIKYPIVCPRHGVFYKNFQDHLYKKQGCPECSGRKRYTSDEFIAKCKHLNHVDNYSFDKTVYINNKTKVTVTCKEHGDFQISPSHLLNGEGCPVCRYIKSANKKRRSFDTVVNEARKVHGDKYDYSLVTNYKNDRIKYPIICKKHGVFHQTFNNHIKGKQGCPVCGVEKSHEERKLTNEEFIEKATSIHGNKYDYSLVNYISSKDKVDIICPTHGIFKQIARNHLFGQGCPKCFCEKSNIESEILEFIKELLPNTKIVENDRTVLDGKEIDIFIPSMKIGFEVNGLIWHSEKFEDDITYHKNKTDIAEEKGYTLYQIFEDEWNEKQTICKSRIEAILGKTQNRLYARDCIIAEISQKEAKQFLNENHLQGYAVSKIRIGLFHNNELISVMTFGKPRINVSHGNTDTQYELIRFSNKLKTSIIGGASKLFSYFVNTYKPKSIISFADRRWFTGGLYEKLGFQFEAATKPSYCYVVNKKRINRFNLRKNILVEKYNCPENITEHEFCNSNGWFRIYDCGTLKYVWKNNK